jgi:hypothetical protein
LCCIANSVCNMQVSVLEDIGDFFDYGTMVFKYYPFSVCLLCLWYIVCFVFVDDLCLVYLFFLGISIRSGSLVNHIHFLFFVFLCDQ